MNHTENLIDAAEDSSQLGGSFVEVMPLHGGWISLSHIADLQLKVFSVGLKISASFIHKEVAGT